MFRRGLRRYEKRLVIVHATPGPSFKGLLVHAYEDCLVLAHADMLDSQQKLGGEVIVPRSPGVWVQTVLTVTQETP